MFGKKYEMPLYENEQLSHECEFKQEGKFNKHEGLPGRLFITDLRVSFYFNGGYTHFLHNLVTSFIWDEVRFKGNNFKIVGYDKKIPIQFYLQVKGKEKRKITTLLEKYPYYDKPAVLKPWPYGDESVPVKVTNDDPLTILKTRFVKGEITKEEFEEMKKDLDNKL